MGGLYGHRNINDEALRPWISAWNEEKYIEFVKRNHKELFDAIGEKRISDQLTAYKEFVAALVWSGEPGFMFDAVYSRMNEIMVSCYFRSGTTAVSVANYYELLLEPSNAFTKDNLISGFHLTERGGIILKKNEQIIGHIGEMSDLFWYAYKDQYIVEKNGGIENARDNSQAFTIQLWDVDSMDDLDERVERILFDCSSELNLDFKRAVLDAYEINTGEAYRIEFEMKQETYELVPIHYFNFANYSPVARHKYLSYYQVIEYFYIRAMKETNLPSRKELDIVTYIISKSISENSLVSWIEEIEYYTNSVDGYPTLREISLENEVVQQVSKRIYSIRCSLVHSKEAADNSNFIPNLNDQILNYELSLIKFISKSVLMSWGEIK